MPHVGLRPVAERDFPALFAMYTDPVAAWMAAFAGDDPDDEPAFRRRWRRILHSPDVIVRAIEADGRLCGTVSTWSEGKDSYVGYWVDRAWWGRGVATYALTEFLHERPRPIRARVAFDNLGSQRVLEKVGFVRVGHAHGRADVRHAVIEEFVYQLA